MSLASKQIMLIDDDEVIRILLKRTLETAGCIVHSCKGIKSALETLKSHAPDLVILDLNMPEYDGFTFLKFRHQNKILASIPVMVLSGTKDKSEIQKALELGADQFLEKPFESRIILQKLRYLFHAKENYFYRFPAEALPQVQAEIQGTLTDYSVGRFKIESQVKFCSGKSVIVRSDDYLGNEGSPVVCGVENRMVEMNDGFFRTTVFALGLDQESKLKFEEWQRTLG